MLEGDGGGVVSEIDDGVLFGDAFGEEGSEPAEDIPAPAEGGDVEEDEDEGEDAGDALEGVSPVGGVFVIGDVDAACEGVIEAEDGMEGDGEPEGEDFHDEESGHVVDEVYFMLEGAQDHLHVGEEVEADEGADGDDSCEGMESA